MKKVLLAFGSLLLMRSISFAANGTVLVIDKLAPKNGAFVGVVDSSQTLTNVTNFNNNLSAADDTVQKALDTLDNMSVSGGSGGGYALEPATVTPRFDRGAQVGRIIISTSNTNVSFGPYIFGSSLTAGQSFGFFASTKNITDAGVVSGINLTPGSNPLIYMYAGDGDAVVLLSSQAATIQSLRQIRLGDADNSNYAGFVAPSVVPANVVWKLPSGDSVGCLQSDGAGNLTIASCGGGGGSSSLAVGTGTASNFTTKITSPTAAISFLGTQFSSLASGTTNFISIANSGVTAGTYGSPTQVSSVTVSADGRVTGAANVTISLTNSNLQAGTYSNVTVPAANVAAGSLGSSVIASSIAVNAVQDASIVSVSASKILAGSLGASVIASSIAVNAVQDASIVGVSGSKITGTGTIPNAAINGSSITKAGVLVAGTNITLTPGSGNTTISATGSSPAGSNTNVQFNNSGSFGGNSGFQYDTSVSSVTIGGALGVNGIASVLSSGTNPLILASQTSGFGAGSTIGFYTNSTNLAGTLGYDSTNNYYGWKDGSAVRMSGASRKFFPDRSSLQIYNVSGANYIAFRSSDTTTSQDYVLPNIKGSAGQVLSINAVQAASGGNEELINLEWATPSSGGTPAGSNSFVQYNNAGSFGADAGFQYDSSVSSVTLNGPLGINNNSAVFSFDSTSSDAYLTIDDQNGTPGGGINLRYNGTNTARLTNPSSAFTIAVATGSSLTPTTRITFPKNNQKTIITDSGANPIAEFDPVNNSSFTIPVYLSTTAIFNKGIKDSNGSYGSAGQYLGSNGAASGVTWQTASGGSGITGSTTTISLTIDGQGSAIVAGSTRSVTVPYQCVISSWSVVADASGSIAVHVSSSTFGNYPTITNMTGAGNGPSLSSQSKRGAAVSGWTQTTIDAGSVISFVVDSASTVKWATVVLWVIR